MTERTIIWEGASGKQYKYWIHDITTSFKDAPGNYIYAKETSPGRWKPIYIGEAKSLEDRLTSNHEKLPCAKRNGATHIHAHTSSSDEEIRRAEEADLIENGIRLATRNNFLER